MTHRLAQGWHVELDHPDTGETVTPQVLDGSVASPNRNPQLNDYPRVRVPVEDRPRWHDSSWEDNNATMRVWLNGRRLPIEELASIDTTSQGVVVLEGRGGVELDTVVDKEFDEKDSHVGAEEVADAATSYTTNFDAPNADTREDVELQAGDTNSELSNNADLQSSDPFVIRNGEVDPAQTLYLELAEDLSTSGGSTATGTGNFTSDQSDDNGIALILSSQGDTASFSFNSDYVWPSANAGIACRVGNPNGIDDGPDFEVRLDGEVLFSAQEGFSIVDNWTWFQDSGTSSDLSAGSHTVEIEINLAGKQDLYVDILVGYDDRWSYSFDNQVDSNFALSGPQLFAQSAQVNYQEASSGQKITAVNLDTTWDDTSNGQEIAVSTDGGQNWITRSNTETLDEDLSSSQESSSIEMRTTHSRYGSRSGTTPTQGFKGQSLDSYSLKADLIDIPRLIDRRFNQRAMSVLQLIADEANAVFEIQRDSNGFSIEWTRAGQRSGQSLDDIIDYNQRVASEEIIRKATVKGSRKPVREETFQSNHGTYVDLNQSELVPGSEAVLTTNGDTQFTRGTDYEIRYSTGEIKTLSSGNMSDSTDFDISYDWRPTGSSTSSKAGNSPPEVVRTITGLTTADQCQQAAARIVGKFEDAPIEADVVIPDDEVGFNLIDALSVDALPTDLELVAREVDNTPTQTEVDLGSTESLTSLIERIQRRVSELAERS